MRCGLSALLLALLLTAAVRADEPALPPWGKALEEELIQAGEPTVEPPCEPRGESWWLRADYLLWWTRNDRVPPLLTTGDTASARPGALGERFTRVLLDDVIDYQERHGARFTFGLPLGTEGTWSADAGYFFLDSRNVGTGQSSPGSPVLARPFFDVVNNREDSSLVAFPGILKGSIEIRSRSFLQGAEANLNALLWEGEESRLTLLAGFRYLDLDEDFSVRENASVSVRANQLAGRTVLVEDRFATQSDFYGGQLGLRSEWRYKRFSLDLLAKVGLGVSGLSSDVSGLTTIDTVVPFVAPAGLFALSSNSGRHTRGTFAVVPELAANVGFRLTDRLTFFGGYTFLYWNRTARAGDQVDRGVNPNLVPTSATFGTPRGPARPAPGVRDTEFWAQGMNLGLMFRY